MYSSSQSRLTKKSWRLACAISWPRAVVRTSSEVSASSESGTMTARRHAPAISGPVTAGDASSSTRSTPKVRWQRAQALATACGTPHRRAARRMRTVRTQATQRRARAAAGNRKYAGKQKPRRPGGEGDHDGLRRHGLAARRGQRGRRGRRGSRARGGRVPCTAAPSADGSGLAWANRCACWRAAPGTPPPGPPSTRRAGDARDRGASARQPAPPPPSTSGTCHSEFTRKVNGLIGSMALLLGLFH